uniref:Uncharacterized protein n=1 Tax=Sipha flava TaxID=143950 RepID=A0A2S2PVQ2_9HEMI
MQPIRFGHPSRKKRFCCAHGGERDGKRAAVRVAERKRLKCRSPLKVRRLAEESRQRIALRRARSIDLYCVHAYTGSGPVQSYIRIQCINCLPVGQRCVSRVRISKNVIYVEKFFSSPPPTG